MLNSDSICELATMNRLCIQKNKIILGTNTDRVCTRLRVLHFISILELKIKLFKTIPTQTI